MPSRKSGDEICAVAEGFCVAREPLIWVVEDDESLRLALVGLFRSADYSAVGFASAEEALRARNGPKADCVVCDIQLPGLSGLELLAEMSSSLEPRGFVMMTARTEPGLQEQVLRAGVQCFLRKPFESDELLECVETVLAKSNGDV